MNETEHKRLKKFLLIFLRNGLIVLGLLFLSFELTPSFYNLIVFFFPELEASSGWGPEAGIYQFLIGFMLGFIFFAPLLFKIFGGVRKNLWIGLLLYPFLLLLILVDLRHFYFYLILPSLGWLIGPGILKLYRLARKETQTK